VAEQVGHYDVIVVGAGTAGLPAAIFASRRGARTLLIDVADRVGGTMFLSTGSLSAAGGTRQRNRGITDSPAHHLLDSLRISHGTGNQDMMRLWQENAWDTLDWMLGEGLELPDTEPSFHAAHELYSVERLYTPPFGVGAKVYIELLGRLLDVEVQCGNVDLRLGTRMTGLLQDRTGAVMGITALCAAAGELEFRGTAVLLATGGYLKSDRHWSRIHGLPRQTYAYEHSNGDGLEAAQAVGAQLAYSENFLPTFGAARDIDVPDKYWFALSPASRRPPWEIMVDHRGGRFLAEDVVSADYRERALVRTGASYFWLLYDDAIRTAAPRMWLWPEEKVQRAFSAHQDFLCCATLEALAMAMNVSSETLRGTVASYNAGQAVGSDVFGRRHMPAPIATGPFFAVKLYATSVVSWGGILTDTSLRVLDATSRPIPGLYAAGEILGIGVFGHSFLGGSMISSALTYGRLLGQKLLQW
jgi:fumarate reductase flavoprotein subunit